MLQGWILVVLITFVSWSVVSALKFRSTGNCSFVKHVSLKIVCKGFVSKEIHELYRDHRAPESSNFSIWQGSEEDSEIFLASFHSPLAEFMTIKIMTNAVYPDQHSFLVEGQSGPLNLKIAQSTIHCFDFSLRYPMELKRLCLGQARETSGNEVAKKPILHYGAFDVQKATSNEASRTIKLRVPVMVATFTLIFYLLKLMY